MKQELDLLRAKLFGNYITPRHLYGTSCALIRILREVYILDCHLEFEVSSFLEVGNKKLKSPILIALN